MDGKRSSGWQGIRCTDGMNRLKVRSVWQDRVTLETIKRGLRPAFGIDYGDYHDCEWRLGTPERQKTKQVCGASNLSRHLPMTSWILTASSEAFVLEQTNSALRANLKVVSQ